MHRRRLREIVAHFAIVEMMRRCQPPARSASAHVAKFMDSWFVKGVLMTFRNDIRYRFDSISHNF